MRGSMQLINCCMTIAIMVCTIGCLRGLNPHPEETNDLKSILSKIRGTYSWRDDLGRYDYSEKLQIEKVLSTRNSEKSLDALTDCLDDRSETRSRIDNENVPLGIICYEALTQLVYYEPTTANGDIAKKWPGYISPKASMQELRKAKQEWKKVIKTKSYIFQ